MSEGKLCSIIATVVEICPRSVMNGGISISRRGPFTGSAWDYSARRRGAFLSATFAKW